MIMPESLKEQLQQIIGLMGFQDFSVSYDAHSSRFLVFVGEQELPKKFIPLFMSNLDHLTRLISRKSDDQPAVFVDVNNYRKEREGLIVELARGAARKAVATKQEVVLPIMNAYERRLIHVELASRPDIKTESLGEGKGRYVVVKPIE